MKHALKTLIAATLLFSAFAASPASAHDRHHAYSPTVLYATDYPYYQTRNYSAVTYYTMSPGGFYIHETRYMPQPPPRVIYVKAKPPKHKHVKHHGHGKDHENNNHLDRGKNRK